MTEPPNPLASALAAVHTAPTAHVPAVPTARSNRLTIVVPCYNEEEVLPTTAEALRRLLDAMTHAGRVAADSHVIFVDDGSRDRTWEIIRQLHATDSRLRGLRLSANRGHQTALIAGLFAADGDAIVSIDADLQDDVQAIAAMVDHYLDGSDVVYGVRQSRETDTVFKRSTAESYYTLLGWLGVKIVHNHADFRLLSRRALEALKQYSEVNLFLRGIVPLIGFKSSTVHYDRAERFAGESKYPLRKMLALAADGVTSFSAFPLRLIAALGVLVSLLSVGMVVWVLWVRLMSDEAVPGWASSVIPIYFLGGIQLLSIGVLGEYVSKLYFEAKRRPRYFVQEVLS
jgi:glycosyltransferase involved in cell wall biosynthesis